MRNFLKYLHTTLEKLTGTPATTTTQTAGNDAVQVGTVTGNVTINQILSPTNQDDAQLLEAYLRWVFRTTIELDLGGIDPKVASKERDACLDLPDVYTALLTMSTTAHEARMAEKRDLLERERLRSAVDLLNAEKHLVLLGDPGSGKSMFVNFVALCMAGAWLHESCANLERLTRPLPKDDGEPEEESQPWEHLALLPMKFVLRDVAAKTLPENHDAPGKVTHLLDFLERLLTESDLCQALPAVKRYLDEQGGLVLFDGLDEVPEADKRRLQILQAVEDFARRFEKCRILVTCRTYAYQRQEWRLKNFPVAVLAPFTDGQIRCFVDGWYRHVAARRETNRENWQGRAALLQQAIFRSAQLRSFARRPLLLTLMASLHAWRGGSLPEKRAELYADATDMLLETWVANKVVYDAEGKRSLVPSLEDLLSVSKTDLKRALQRLAFEAHQRQPASDKGTADIAENDLVLGLLDVCRAQHLNPLDVAEHLSNRVGLLTSHGHHVYTFPHRSFQEYLAACHLTADGNYPYNIAELVRDSPDRWREVAVLAAAETSKFPVMLVGFVDALCPASAPEVPHAATNAVAYAALLAAQAVVEAHKVSELGKIKPDQVQRLRGWLTTILTEKQPEQPLPAVERALAGNLLAQLGDPRPGVGLREDGLPDIKWIQIPAGTFTMGSNDFERSQPPHSVTFQQGFQISRYPVTNAQYQAFIADGGQPNEKYGGAFDLSNHPVVGVSWNTATAFCEWLTQRLQAAGDVTAHETIRLPTEAEWEYAARGPHPPAPSLTPPHPSPKLGEGAREGSRGGRGYPWGNDDPTPELANYSDTGLGTTSAVGCFPRGATPEGCQDMAGNVWEWCQDVWQDSHKNAPNDGSARETGKDINLRLLKGGAYWYGAGNMRCADRGRYDRSYRNNYRGFRLVRAVRR